MPIHMRYDHIVDFPLHLKRIFSAFPKENIFILLYDDLKNSKEKVMRNLFSFLEVDNSFVPDFTPRNLSKGVKNRILKNYIDMIKLPFTLVLKRVGLLKRNSFLHKLYLSVFIVDKRRSKVLGSQKSVLQKRYQKIVEETAEIIEIDLINYWNYPIS